jgi:hypothetical protein
MANPTGMKAAINTAIQMAKTKKACQVAQRIAKADAN